MGWNAQRWKQRAPSDSHSGPSLKQQPGAWVLCCVTFQISNFTDELLLTTQWAPSQLSKHQKLLTRLLRTERRTFVREEIVDDAEIHSVRLC